ncbi:MAG: hypothetical protein JOZ19_03600 [Rubrobacter sp.]|nr:hypothetical protein [Rubrobacter sp.]
MFRPLSTPEGQIPTNHFGIGTSVLIPWDETNQPHRLTISIQREEDGTELGRVETDVEVGRPPGLPAGTDQRAVFGIGADISFPEQGEYRVIATIDEDTRSASFRVSDFPSQFLSEAPR